MSEDSLPGGWVKCPTSDVATLIRGVSYSKEDARKTEAPGCLPILRANNIDGAINFDDLTFVRSNLISSEQRLRSGDILFAMSSGSINLVGKSARITRDLEAGFGAFCGILRPSPDISNQFLAWVYQTREFRHAISEVAKGSNINNLKREHLLDYEIPLPPLAEQKRIVAKIEELFSELDAGEESLRRARRQLGVYRQSLLKQAFEGKLTAKWRAQHPDLLESPDQLLARIQAERQARYQQQLKEWEKATKAWEKSGKKGKRPSKPSEPSTFDRKSIKNHDEVIAPNDWVVEVAGNCPTDSLIGLVRSATEQHSGPSGFSYIKMDRIDMLGNVDLAADVFVECTEEEADRFALRAGDILFNTRNSVELVGKSGVVRRDTESTTVYNNNLMRIRLPDCLDPVFFGFQLCSQPFRQRMEKVKKATTSVAAIYAKDFWPLPLALPSLPEQQEIVRLLDEQFEVIEQNDREIDAALKRSEALRQSILKKAFTGQLVAQDPTDEPASALLERIRNEWEGSAASKQRKKKVALKRLRFEQT